ncbi:unnamed protein product [Closterium sp. NIES-64]|nr:unnamed protein product [Closterium sp. NIES-64]
MTTTHWGDHSRFSFQVVICTMCLSASLLLCKPQLDGTGGGAEERAAPSPMTMIPLGPYRSTSPELLKNVLLFTNDDDPFGAIFVAGGHVYDYVNVVSSASLLCPPSDPQSTSQEVLKNVLLFTNDDDPFGAISNEGVRSDMRRTTRQKAKDARALGIQIDLFPLSRPGEKFNSTSSLRAQSMLSLSPEEHRRVHAHSL